MPKIFYLLLFTLLLGCGDSETRKELNEFGSYIKQLEYTALNCSALNWSDQEDSLSYYLGVLDSTSFSEGDKGKFKTLIERFGEIKDSDEINSTIHFYLDNSISMRGYFQGQDFRPVLAQLLYLDRTTKYNLFFANEKVVYQSDNSDDYFDQFERLNRHINADKSDLNNTFTTVLENVSDSSVGIFISDGIYSMGDATRALEELKIKSQQTTLAFEKQLSKKPKIQTIVYKMQSRFMGDYYDEFDKGYTFNGTRPFYIWFFGNELNLNKLLCQLELDANETFMDKVRYSAISENDCDYTITNYGEIGHFKNEFEDTLWHAIKDIEVSDQAQHHGKFGCSIAIDFNNIPCDPSYLINAANYEIKGGGFKVDSIQVIDNDLLEYGSELRVLRYQQMKTNFNPSHFIFISTNKPIKSTVKITLNNNDPEWILQTSTLQTEPDDHSTFGFYYLMKGIADAYKKLNRNTFYTSFQIELKD